MSAENQHERGAVRIILENHLGPWIFFAALVFLIGAWVLADNSMPKEHSGRTLLDSWALFNWFKNGGRMPLNGYPPFCNIIACLAYALSGGFSAKAAILSQLAFLLPMGYGVFYIGRRLGGLWGGVLALLSVGGNLWLHLYARGYFLEVGESAALVCIFASFIASGCFRRLKPSLLFGVCLGIGMLIKWAVLFYIAPILVYSAVKVFFFDKSPAASDSSASALSSKRIFMYALGIAVLICGWWYAAAFFELLHKSGRDASQAYYSGADIFRPLFAALGNGYWLAFVWFSIGCIAHIKYAEDGSPFIVYCTLSMLVSMLAIYTAAGVPAVPRYVLPGSLLISAVGFSAAGKIKYVYIKPALCAGVLLINLIQLNLFGAGIGRPLNDGLNMECSAYISHLEKADKAKSAGDAELKDFSDALLAVIVSELRRSGESRFTAVSVRGRNGGIDPDMLILRSLEVYNFPIDIDIYAPGRFEFEPKTSLLLFINDDGGIYLKDKHFQGYRKIGAWKNGYTQNYASLYKNDGKHDSKAAMPSFVK